MSIVVNFFKNVDLRHNCDKISILIKKFPNILDIGQKLLQTLEVFNIIHF